MNDETADPNAQNRTTKYKVSNEKGAKIFEIQARKRGALFDELLDRIDESNQTPGEDCGLPTSTFIYPLDHSGLYVQKCAKKGQKF